MTVQYLKSLKITKLRKEVKKVISWDRFDGCSREIIINSIEKYEKKSSPKYSLFMQELKNAEPQF